MDKTLMFGVLAALCAVADIAHYAWVKHQATAEDTELSYIIVRRLGDTGNEKRVWTEVAAEAKAEWEILKQKETPLKV